MLHCGLKDRKVHFCSCGVTSGVRGVGITPNSPSPAVDTSVGRGDAPLRQALRHHVWRQYAATTTDWALALVSPPTLDAAPMSCRLPENKKGRRFVVDVPAPVLFSSGAGLSSP